MAKVLLIGSGGREHALAWALSRSEQVEAVFVAPGNGGTEWEASDSNGLNPGAASKNIALNLSNPTLLLDFVHQNEIDLTVVGPEAPLVDGIVDHFQSAKKRIFGPTQAAAQLEGSKAFSKEFMTEQGIPTGEYFTSSHVDEALQFLEEYKRPVVVKASGLAAGKGVLICDSHEEARAAIKLIMTDRAFGDAGETIVIEERLSGRELSVLAFCDGKTVKPMLIARDYKRALDGNAGLNTGGMGAIAPADDISQELIDDITKTVLQPTVDGMKNLGTPYVGILYAGLMLTENGPKVLEFNCRFGDPETQVILPLLKTDLYEIMQACIDGKLKNIDIEWDDVYCATVVCAAPGYPASYPKGLAINGLDSVQDSIVFHAGTKQNESALVTNGGRVLNVTSLGDDLDGALEKSYSNVNHIAFDGMHYRTDIGTIYD